MGELIFNDEIQAVQESPLNIEDDRVVGTSFIYEGAIVHLKFASDGKRLEDLLINYFKSLK